MALRCPSLAKVLVALVLGAHSVQVPDLQAFFSSPKGLAMFSSDAYNLASKEAASLTECRITVPFLQALKDAMYLPSMLNLDLETVRQQLLPLAYQHASPADLNTFYQTLHSFTFGLMSKDAASVAMDLAAKHASPSIVMPLFQILSSYSGVGLPRSLAQAQSISLTAAGTDATTLGLAYRKAVLVMGRSAALQTAIEQAVAADLFGLPGRYAKDGRLYTATGFQTYYGLKWLDEWQAAPEEKRTARDGQEYRASEFLVYFGPSWSSEWNDAPVAEMHRIAGGYTYTLAEFQSYYKDTWQAEWASSYEVLDVCAGLSQSQCSSAQQYKSKCQWQWSGDWTTSCVVQPLIAQEALMV